jgi:hypothetical protein
MNDFSLLASKVMNCKPQTWFINTWRLSYYMQPQTSSNYNGDGVMI